jgi:hypothetical protein
VTKAINNAIDNTLQKGIGLFPGPFSPIIQGPTDGAIVSGARLSGMKRPRSLQPGDVEELICLKGE